MKDPVRANICVGGTFWPLHIGHRTLLEVAFRQGDHVGIGITTDDMAREGRSRYVAPLYSRLDGLIPVLDEFSRRFGVDYVVRPISDHYGFAIDPKYTTIVVSEMTEETTDLIDKERLARGSEPLKRIVVRMVKDENGKVISSTRIQNGEVDEEGVTTAGENGRREAA